MKEAHSNQHVLNGLNEGKIVLMPTDTEWRLVWCLSFDEPLNRILGVKEPSQHDPLIVLVKDVDQLKSVTGRIHPRVETLLELHRRPLGLFYENPMQLPQYLNGFQRAIACQVANTKELQHIIAQNGQPLVSVSAFDLQAENFDYLSIPKKVLDMADIKAMDGKNSPAGSAPIVLAHYNHEGELEFIRE